MLRPFVLRLLLISFLFPALNSPVTAQPKADYFLPGIRPVVLQEALPSDAGMSAERLGRIDELVKEYVDKKWIAGATALVVRNGKIVYYKGMGYNDADKRTPLSRDAIFRIASQTKAIATTAVMILYEEGKIRLDDAISKYIPEFKNPVVLDKFNPVDSSYTTVPAKSEITIRQLITHTSGIDYAVIGSKNMTAIYEKAGISSGIGTENTNLATEIKKLAKMPLVHQPGEKWTYSLGIDVLGYLVEVVSGMPFDQFLKKRIFDVIGMKDTYFYLPPDKHNRLAILYTEDSLHHLIKYQDNDRYHADYPNSKGTYFSGGAGLSSSMYDYAIFLQTMLNGGTYNGKRLLSRNTVRLMTSNQIGSLNVGDNKFGLGFGIVTEKGAANGPQPEGSFNWGGYFGTTYWADPKEKIIGLMMTQQVPNSHGELMAKFQDLVYAAIND